MGLAYSLTQIAEIIDVEDFLRKLEDFDPKRKAKLIDVFENKLEKKQLECYKFKGNDLNEVIQDYFLHKLMKIKDKITNKNLNKLLISNEFDKSFGLFIFGNEQHYGDTMPRMIENYNQHQAIKKRLKEWLGDKTCVEVQNEILYKLTLYPFEEHAKIILGIEN